jgi:hypothetical protein
MGSWVIVEGFVVDGPDVGFGGTNARLQNSEIKNCVTNCLTGSIQAVIKGPSTGIELINLDVHDNGKSPNCYPTGPEYTGECHLIYADDTGLLIDGGHWHDTVSYCIHSHLGGIDWTIRNVLFTNCGSNIFTSSGHKIYNNTFIRSTFGLYSSNITFVNNTLYEGKNGFGIDLRDITGSVIRNNIFYNIPQPITADNPGENTIDHNLTTDPGFTNPAAGDFHLTANSPAIDAGMTLAEVTTDADRNTRPAGGAYDIGAYEYGATGGPPKLSGIPVPSTITTPGKATPYPTPTIFYLTPVFTCLGSCPTLPPTPTPTDEADNPDGGDEIQEPPAEEEPPSDETIEAPREDTGKENTPPEEAPSEGQPEIPGEQTGSNGLQQLLGLIIQLIQAILKLFLFPI